MGGGGAVWDVHDSAFYVFVDYVFPVFKSLRWCSVYCTLRTSLLDCS